MTKLSLTNTLTLFKTQRTNFQENAPSVYAFVESLLRRVSCFILCTVWQNVLLVHRQVCPKFMRHTIFQFTTTLVIEAEIGT